MSNGIKLRVTTINVNEQNCNNLFSNMGRSELPDIICLQECTADASSRKFERLNPRYKNGLDRMVETNVFGDLKNRLGNMYTGIFAPATKITKKDAKGKEYTYHYGLATFFKSYMQKMLHVDRENQNFPILKSDDGNSYPRNALIAPLEIAPDNFLTIINYHGFWRPEGKGDCDERRLQATKLQQIKNALAYKKENYILCGDFNILRDSPSFEILKNGDRDIALEFNIQNTRSKEYLEYAKAEREACDFILIPSKDEIAVSRCWTNDKDTAFSDHLAVQAQLQITL